MLRVTTLYAGSAAATARYYTKYLTRAPGEQPGVWSGAQAAGLGLVGEVSTDALEQLLTGCNPLTGVTLGNPLVDRTRANGTVIRAVAGFDATVSAPKSLSVWWALTGDPGLAECHDIAVKAVVDYLERFGSTTRIRSNGGRLHPDSQGLIVAGFRQTTSRLNDPQLHTHLVISAKVQTDDGRWLALDARVLKQHQRALGGLYQSVLRAELTDRYGVAFAEIVNGQAEIAGVPTELLEQFSKRAAQVNDELQVKVGEFHKREGRSPTRFEHAALEREAAADTRTRKTGNTNVEPRRPRYTSSSITGNPYSLRRLGLRRLTDVVKRTSGGHWNAEHAKRLLAAAHEAITLWAGGGIDFDELAWDLASEVRVLRQLDDEIGRLDTRITGLYDRADPKGIIRSAPGIGDAAHAAPRVHHRRARRRRPTPRRPRSCVTRRPPNDNALRPFTSLTRPAREIRRVHFHRRRRTMTAQNDWRAAHIQGIRRYLGSDPLGYMTAGWSVPQCLHFVAGSAVD